MENNRIKQRIVGAVILVSIAVIVLPMILSESGEREISSSNIPQKPENWVKTEIIPLEIKKLPDPADSVQRRVDQKSNSAESANIKEPSEIIMASPVEEAVTAPEAKPVVKPKPPKTVSPREPKKPEVIATVSGWVVQVGSFSSQSNAMALRDKLEASGFNTFVERVDGNNIVYRVRVGPEIKKAQAQVVKAALKEKMALDGLVIRHQ
ncbi:hypothetical protein MNBD_GAMMA18-2192 [hydrothermal vent metagenome]|uniref:SPOR domain-containing protein n=1 Tax=hydrothermal vent metagenome TaxID=652676 RepID=A0A3B0ZIU7_9ZZZZ